MQEEQIVYLYDGSYTGFLTALFDAWRAEDAFGDIRLPLEGSLSLFEREQMVVSDRQKANRVARAIQQKVSQDSYEAVYHVFRSDLPERGRVIYRYLKLAFRMGPEVNAYLVHPDVLAMQKINQRYLSETKRMLGFVRFQQAKGDFLYAKIAPAFPLLEPLAVFFADRMPGQKWIIYDSKRKCAALCNGRQWMLQESFSAAWIEEDTEELSFQIMWQEYLAALSIPERHNDRLQQQHIPLCYRQHMLEWDALPSVSYPPLHGSMSG